MKNVSAVVVTFNKLDYLKKCLVKLDEQSYGLTNIIVVDNASTDDTLKYMDEYASKNEKIIYYRLDNNLGGSGGFNAGLKKAWDIGSEYVWIMDDDSMPTEKALEKLMVHAEKPELNVGFLCSNVRWIDNAACKMNIPSTAGDWNAFVEQGLVKCTEATFVSLLVPRDIIEEFGYPITEFFIWGDDTEYTSRITQKYSGYLVNDSIVIHEMANNLSVDIIEDSANRIPRYYYRYRNKGYTLRHRNKKKFIKYSAGVLVTCMQILAKKNPKKFKKIFVVLKGYFAGFTFNPRIEKP